MAPEIVRGKGYTLSADWWSFGVLLFEMVAGHPPFEGETELEIYQAVMLASPIFPASFSTHLKGIISKLLQTDLTRRLGCTFMGVEEIKDHPWYARGWTVAEAPPVVPNLAEPCFDQYAHMPIKTSAVDLHQGLFAAF